MHRLIAWVALIQGIYYALTGLWPLLHMPSFLAVTGPKRDLWLVRTVGILVLVIGTTLIVAAARWQASDPPILVLALGSAAGLGTIDVVYPAKGVISQIYLLDALAEAVLIALWIWGTIAAW
jgi:hypothetical protein